MMSVKEYADSMDMTVAEVLKKCMELNIEVTSGTDELSDDDIINLDYAINLISSDDETTLDEEDEIDEVVDDIMETSSIKTINDTDKKQKLKKRSEIQNSKEEYMNKRKELYKDQTHLNDSGAHVFSSRFASDLNRILNDKNESFAD